MFEALEERFCEGGAVDVESREWGQEDYGAFADLEFGGDGEAAGAAHEHASVVAKVGGSLIDDGTIGETRAELGSVGVEGMLFKDELGTGLSEAGQQVVFVAEGVRGGQPGIAAPIGDSGNADAYDAGIGEADEDCAMGQGPFSFAGSHGENIRKSGCGCGSGGVDDRLAGEIAMLGGAGNNLVDDSGRGFRLNNDAPVLGEGRRGDEGVVVKADVGERYPEDEGSHDR